MRKEKLKITCLGSTMMKVLGRRSSSNVQAVMWCLAELEIPVEREDAGYIYGVVDTDDYRALNPNGTIPTLIDGDHDPIWETGAILRYIAHRYGTEPFWPEDLMARTKVDQWAEWAKIGVAIKFGAPIFHRLVRTAPSKRNYDAINEAVVLLDRYLDIAAHQLSTNSYLAGDNFTLADIQFGHSLYRYFDVDIKRPQRDVLKRYYDQLCERPAYRDHVLVSYDELRVSD